MSRKGQRLTGDVNSYGLDRVYQLCVNRASKPVKDAHRHSHEHLGSLRRAGSTAWPKWGYDEILAYFCTQRILYFCPRPPIQNTTGKDGTAVSNLADMFGSNCQIYDDNENLAVVGGRFRALYVRHGCAAKLGIDRGQPHVYATRMKCLPRAAPGSGAGAFIF